MASTIRLTQPCDDPNWYYALVDGDLRGEGPSPDEALGQAVRELLLSEGEDIPGSDAMRITLNVELLEN